MSPTEIENSLSVNCEEQSLVQKNGDEILGFKMYHCDTAVCARGERRTSSSEANNSFTDFDTDDLMNLFKLAVIFTRGNPFDSDKHWRMRFEFLETNLKIGCFEKIGELDEDILNSPVTEINASVVLKSNPVVRLIYVLPNEDRIDNELVEKEMCYEGPVQDGYMKDVLCICANEAATAQGNEDIQDKRSLDIALKNALTGASQSKDDNRAVIVTDDVQPRQSFDANQMFLSRTDAEILNRAPCSIPRNNPTRQLPQTPTNTPPSGCFAQAIQRILDPFRKKKVGVLPLRSPLVTYS